MRIGVISHSQKHSDRPERYVSKNAANALVRRLLAVRLTKTLIQMCAIREMAYGRPADAAKTPTHAVPTLYEHHIEPRIETFGFADTEWLRYLNGYDLISE